MRWRKETFEMDIQEFGYSTDGNRFYGRYRTRGLAEAEALDKGLAPTHTARRRVDGNSALEIVPFPGSIQEILDTSDDSANVLFRAARQADREAHVATREARRELNRERRRVRRLGKVELAEEMELADMAHAERAAAMELDRAMLAKEWEDAPVVEGFVNNELSNAGAVVEDNWEPVPLGEETPPEEPDNA